MQMWLAARRYMSTSIGYFFVGPFCWARTCDSFGKRPLVSTSDFSQFRSVLNSAFQLWDVWESDFQKPLSWFPVHLKQVTVTTGNDAEDAKALA